MMTTTRTRTALRLARIVTGTLLSIGLVVGGSPAFAGSPLLAQTRGPVQRTLVGKVQTKDGTAIKGAVVYLKDDRSNSVRSEIAGDDGSYRFVQLAQSTDYELWAQSDSKKSKTRSISSFDSRNDLSYVLTIDK